MQKVIMIGAAGIGIAIVALALWYTSSSVSETSSHATSTSVITTLPAGDSRAPSITQPVRYSPQLNPTMRAATEKKIAELRKQLFEDPTSFPAWLDLALQYKVAEDYTAARDVWEYLNIAAPTQSISFHNLGNLYHLHLRDFKKSEEMYQQAIQNAPTIAIHYLELHDLYRYSYQQNTTKAADVLLQGLKVMPEAVDLMVALATYYKDAKSPQKAIHYYTEARDVAIKLGNAGLISQLDQEISALK